MKKTIALTAAMLISCSALSLTVFAAENEAKVYVTISNDKKELVLTQEPVTVTDIDNDGKLTINDALYIAHENNFEGGAEAGYKSSVGQWGLGLDKLWGVENGGSYGYYVNDNFAMGLADEIKNDDYIEAFIYPDPKDYNYFYSFFDAKNGEDADSGSNIDLTLSYYSFGADGAMITNKLEGAKITINGNDTEFVTDSDGKVTVTLSESGKNVISAASDTVKIVPPSYVINVKGEAVTTTEPAATTTTSTTTKAPVTTTTTTKAKATTTTTKKKSDSPQTGDNGAIASVIAFGAAAVTAFMLRRRNEE